MPASEQPRATILLVENEPALLRVAALTLRRAGYKVFQALSPREAVGLWTTEKESIDLLITDLDLAAEQTGWELARDLMRQKPALRTIFVSGSHFHLLGPEASRYDRLEKPFSAGGLLSLVQSVLGRPEQ